MKTIFTYVTLLLFSASSFAEISSTEKNALIKLNKATKGSQWINKWDLKTPVSTWYGVEIENDKVVSIKLVNNNLNGELPKEIGDLTSLQVLNLFRNKSFEIYFTELNPVTTSSFLKSLRSKNIKSIQWFV